MSDISKKLLAFILIAALVESTFSITDDLTQESDNFKSNSNDLKIDNEYRLENTVLPTAYDVQFSEVEFSNFTFKGSVKINARIVKETNVIVLHRGNLTAYVTSVTSIENNKGLTVAGTSYNKTTEKLSILLEEYLKPSDNISIQLNFNGTLRNDMIGFYRSSYINERGVER
jgi:aminopeptidase N